MNKKILALLVAATLCMILLAMPFSASAASSISYSLNGYRCTGNLSMGQDHLQRAYATATSGFETMANSITAQANIYYGFGTIQGTFFGPITDQSPGSYTSSTATAPYYSSVAIKAQGTHHVTYYGGQWDGDTSIGF